MAVQLHNTLTRQLEPLVPRDAGRVAMYVCGVTPYDYPHIGNARAVVAFDTVRRYLEYAGFAVTYIQNFTDIDDKIINRANEQGVPWQSLPERFIGVYFEEMDTLNVQRATLYPKATEHITEIVTLVGRLVANGLAYTAGGDVYFSVRDFAGYGKLSGRDLDEQDAGSRVEVSDIKCDPLDFALWKGSKPGEPAWESPWGPGRPGWHIECSAMAGKYLGQGFDIHAGGQDLIFPHHENEIAQSEGADGVGTFARYWLHNGFVTINKEKMSKSLGNFFTVREVLERYPAPVVRYFLTAAHYRSPLDFSDQALDMAQAAYERLATGVASIARVVGDDIHRDGGDEGDSTSGTLVPHPALAALQERVNGAEADFRAAMDEDFNTPKAIAVLFEVVGAANKLTGDATFIPDAAARAALTAARELVLRLAGVLGILLDVAPEAQDSLAPELMQLLIDLRAQARTERNFAMADAIRTRLAALDIVLEDTPQGTTWRRG
jgi:cysteinyl-tRNA synthetase